MYIIAFLYKILNSLACMQKIENQTSVRRKCKIIQGYCMLKGIKEFTLKNKYIMQNKKKFLLNMYIECQKFNENVPPTIKYL